MSVDAQEIAEALRGHVEAGAVPGAVVAVLQNGRVTRATVGSLAPDAVVRISSNTKPIVAAAALAMVEDGTLRLDEPVDEHLPELRDRRVLTAPGASLEDTVPAERPITLRDLLTMRMGFGHVMDGPSPAVERATALGLGFGPPDPASPLTPDAWIARFAELPLLDQPGTVWRYELSFAVLGILLARAAGTSLPEVVRTRVTDPLGMSGTAFSSAALPPQCEQDGDDLKRFDGPGAESRWARPPALPDARGGLVSTADDLLRFAGALLGGGAPILATDSVATMTTDALSAGQRDHPSSRPFLRDHPSSRPFLRGGGYGFGVGTGPGGERYGWAGGLGTLWWSWPAHATAAVLITQVVPPVAAVFDAFTDSIETRLAA